MTKVHLNFLTEKSEKFKRLTLQDGTKFEWMFHRKKGMGPVLIAKDLTWINETPIIAFKFFIDSNNKRYNFVVPLICSNISLRGVTGVPIVIEKPVMEKVTETPIFIEPVTPTPIIPPPIVI